MPTCSSLRRPVCDQVIDALCRLLCLAMLSHTRPICIIPVGVVEVATLLKGGRARSADAGASLGITWRCQRGHGEPQGKHSHTFLQDSHDESPSIMLLVGSFDRIEEFGRSCRPVTSSRICEIGPSFTQNFENLTGIGARGEGGGPFSGGVYFSGHQ